MADKIGLWCGFYFQVFQEMRPELGGKTTIALTSTGEMRETPEEAWGDALILEKKGQEHVAELKKKKELEFQMVSVKMGICPADYSL